MEWPCRNRLFLLLSALIVLVQISGSNGCFEEEKTALLDFKAYAKFNNVITEPFLSSWVNDRESDCCYWERVTCDSHSKHVIHLSLGGLHQESEELEFESEFRFTCVNVMSLNFSHFLPFKQLKNLNLSDGCLVHGIMSEDYGSRLTLMTLETLDLSYNAFNMTILEPISAIKSLKNLIIAHNSMGGPFPIKELSFLENLELLDLSDNQLYESLEFQDNNTWASLKDLRTLKLSSNLLSMEILKPLASLPALRCLYLNDNQEVSLKDYYSGRYEGLDDKALANLSNLETLMLRRVLTTTTELPINGLCKMKNLQELDLSDNYFNGTLHSCLSNLTSLHALDLSNNLLSGSIPSPFIASLTSLEYLHISHNKFEGRFSLNSMANHSMLKALIVGEMDSNKFQVETENPLWIPLFQLEYLKMPNCGLNSPARTIPSFLSYQHNLRYIDISSNSLSDTFPNWLLENNPKLHGVLLNNNSFTGPFQLPSNLNQQMDQLHVLDISNNKIQGELPKNIGFLLPCIKYLNAMHNKFEGNIPYSIGEMSNLSILNLANNDFSGEVPKQLLLGCISLEFLRLSNNSLEGEIFSSHTNMRLLTTLILENNNFNGTLGDGLLSMLNLKVLAISNNKLSGELPNWLGKLSLSIFSASSNSFHGVIPNDLCQAKNLALIDFSYNRLSGPIPSCLSFSSLNFIQLKGNNITGTMPKELITNSSLRLLDLRENKIYGSIPMGIDNSFSYLVILLLGGNQLEGHLSNQTCDQLRRLDFMDLSRNNFNGSIPLCFNNMSFGKRVGNFYDEFNPPEFSFAAIYYQYLDFDMTLFYEWKNDFIYAVEEQLTTKSLSITYKGVILRYMSGMDLSCNKLSGEIPKQIGNLHAIYSLNLSHNQLCGSIPENFNNLKQIESLDLSYNYLSGTIPLQLQELNSLSLFNVSYNNLSGRAPNQGQFGTFDENSYKGNPYLLVNNSNRGIATSKPPPSDPLSDEEEESPIDFIAFCWCFSASYITILLVFATILWINPYWRRRWFYFIETCLYKCLGQFFDGAF